MFSKAEKIAIITDLVALNIAAWGITASLVNRFGIPSWQTISPEPTSVPSAPIAELPPLPTRTPARPPSPTREKIRTVDSFFKVGPFDFDQPTSPLFIFTNIDGKIIKAYAYPKQFRNSKDQAKIFDDWQDPINGSVLNITSQENSFFNGFIIQSCHSFENLPCEGLRLLLEANGQPFTTTNLKNTVNKLESADVTILQGPLAPGAKIESVDITGKNLVTPARSKAKITGLIRYGPLEVNELNNDYGVKDPNNGQYVNILDSQYMNQTVATNKPPSVNPDTDFALELCGGELLVDKLGRKIELPTPNTPWYRQTRYVIFYSLAP